MATNIPDDKRFEAALKALSKNFGSEYANRPLADAKLKAIPTGHDDLDCLLTRGAMGLYKGGIVELLGAEGSGKSSMALRAVATVTRAGGKCCWFDCESAFDEHLAVLNGVDLNNLILPSITELDGEQDSVNLFNVNKVLEMMYRSIASNVYDIVVLDSVAGLAPDRILTDDFLKDPDKMGVAEVARAMSQMLKKISPACAKTETTAIFVNQLRDQPGSYVTNPYHTPGGKALRYFAHQRISVAKVNGEKGRVCIEKDGKPYVIGHYAKCVIVKNRKAPPVQPGTEIEVPIYYQEYFPDDANKCYDLARKLQVITIRNSTLTWKGPNGKILEVDGESGLLAKIREDKLEGRLAAACVEAAAGERNQGLKSPVLVPAGIKQLASEFSGNDGLADSLSAPETKPSAKSGKRKPPAIDL